MSRPPAALHAVELLKEMRQAGVDPDPVFQQVADTLLKRHGRSALQLAQAALARMAAAGDRDAWILWEGVHQAMGNAITGRFAKAGLAATATLH
jgi:hypothetical protein